ncbi:MAG: hypothetical protein R3C56_28640 [Pirellulaceae bacterium]
MRFTEVLFCLALVAFVLFGLIEPKLAWDGFADEGVIAIAGLLVVSAALRAQGCSTHWGVLCWARSPANEEQWGAGDGRRG